MALTGLQRGEQQKETRKKGVASNEGKNKMRMTPTEPWLLTASNCKRQILELHADSI